MIWLTIIATAGALQGSAILLSMALKLRHGRNLPLALLIIVFSLRLATIPTWNYDILYRHPWLWPATTALPFLFAPLVWWHIRDMIREEAIPLAGLKWHCLPWFLEVLLLCITFIFMDSSSYDLFLKDVFSGHPPLWLPVRNGLKVLVNVVYLFLALLMVFSKDALGLSKAKRVWMRSFVIVPFLVLFSFSVVAVLPEMTGRLARGDTTAFLILSFLMSLLILLIATFFMVCPDLFFLSEKFIKKEDKQFPEEQCRVLLERLERRMAEGAFRNPDLSLPDLAAEFGVSSNLLSHTVNTYCGKGFRSYVNGKRLDFFLEEIGKGKRASFLELAFDAGFSSKSTFNRFFHESMGMTPTDYLRFNPDE